MGHSPNGNQYNIGSIKKQLFADGKLNREQVQQIETLISLIGIDVDVDEAANFFLSVCAYQYKGVRMRSKITTRVNFFVNFRE